MKHPVRTFAHFRILTQFLLRADFYSNCCCSRTHASNLSSLNASTFATQARKHVKGHRKKKMKNQAGEGDGNERDGGRKRDKMVGVKGRRWRQQHQRLRVANILRQFYIARPKSSHKNSPQTDHNNNNNNQ